MKKNLAATLSGALAVALLGLAAPASADFSGDYAVGNWTFANNPDTGLGSVDTSGAPGSILLTGSDGASGGQSSRALFTIAAAGTGTVIFQWRYMTSDSTSTFDPAGYLNAGAETQLSNNGVSSPQPALGFNNAMFDVIQGNVFGFYVDSTDNDGGAGQIEISSFSAPSGSTPPPALPEPGSLALLALGLLGMSALRNRQQG